MTSTTYLNDSSYRSISKSKGHHSANSDVFDHRLLNQFNSRLETEYLLRTKSKHKKPHSHSHNKKFEERHPKAFNAMFIGSTVLLAGTWGYCMYELFNNYDSRSEGLSAGCNSTSVWNKMKTYENYIEGLKEDHPDWNITIPDVDDEESNENRKSKRSLWKLEDVDTIVEDVLSSTLPEDGNNNGNGQFDMVWTDSKKTEGDERFLESGESVESKIPIVFTAYRLDDPTKSNSKCYYTKSYDPSSHRTTHNFNWSVPYHYWNDKKDIPCPVEFTTADQDRHTRDTFVASFSERKPTISQKISYGTFAAIALAGLGTLGYTAYQARHQAELKLQSENLNVAYENLINKLREDHPDWEIPPCMVSKRSEEGSHWEVEALEHNGSESEDGSGSERETYTIENADEVIASILSRSDEDDSGVPEMIMTKVDSDKVPKSFVA
ncbi:hypothetical protein L486_08239 [Kwoniella mangroviensis CBS 10435]|uniref:Uncharacterized protein n=1 Tax=Kwoniella mangroviensis CBS 10435 TaxID=1331196 RepID=A0A1B9IFI4_9TREE|nr:hypothetical protein L486_08239 [Kwoniella mangroviensis CBS 10435]